MATKTQKVIIPFTRLLLLDGACRRAIGQLLEVNLPTPRTDGLYRQCGGSKADLQFFIHRHLYRQGYKLSFELVEKET